MATELTEAPTSEFGCIDCGFVSHTPWFLDALVMLLLLVPLGALAIWTGVRLFNLGRDRLRSERDEAQ